MMNDASTPIGQPAAVSPPGKLAYATPTTAPLVAGRPQRPRPGAALCRTTEGRWTNDFPITVQGARQLGLPVSVNMPPIIYELMDLYPQGRAGRPSVLYMPIRREPDLSREQREGVDRPVK